MLLELMVSVFIPWGEFCIEMLASCWCHWLIPNWHLFYCLAAVQIFQTNNVEMISYYPSQTCWMYSFWAFVEALGLIATLILLVAPLDGARGVNRSDGTTLYSWLSCTTWMLIQSTEECWPGAIGCEVLDEVSGSYMIMLFVCHRMWAFSVLTPVLSSRCCADSPNKQCVSDCTASKSIILNVFTLGYHHGYFIDWIPWFFWWHVLTAGSASSSQSCLLLSKSPPEFIVRHLILYEGKYKKE
jgi:hypothetical protein